ncbi:MAG TPA: hypothetical protein PK323_07600 [Bacteroidia bacterium]|nr:hypothetical protein [Bacteroidia bacterium]
MKNKILYALLVLSSLFGYLSWGTNQSSFLYQIEWETIKKLFIHTSSIIHPLTIIPLIGQLMLLGNLFQKKTSNKLGLIGISCLGVLFVFMLLVGMLSKQVSIVFSCLPFLLLSIYTMYEMSKTKKKYNSAAG